MTTRLERMQARARGEGPKVHHTITAELICQAVEGSMFETENLGYCLCCGAEAHDVEPDAQNYQCETCDELQVFGAQQILLAEYFAGRPLPASEPPE